MAAPNGGIPVPVNPPLVALVFRRSDLAPVRRLVAAAAAQAGLFGTRLQSFVLAVNEITTNAVLHGGGLGRLRLWHDDAQLICEVTDTGPGLPVGHTPAETAPPPDATGGRGLWLTGVLCDRFSVHSNRDGTTVRMATSLGGAS
jgi:anti-sigma regulatory factor (Ser/Thr protein kinase)